jgi:glycine/D-amino acid oxidase-like deaminating enzyme
MKEAAVVAHTGGPMDGKSKRVHVKKGSDDPNSRRSTSSVWSSTPSAHAKSGPAKKALKGPIRKNEQCDVCIVGAGIAGLTIAYFLAREGKSVIVLEKDSIGQGETIHTSAHLSNAIDAGFREIERNHGENGARLAAESHTAAIRAIETIVQDENIDCDFRRVNGYLFLGSKDSSKVLEDELEAARRAGLDARMEQAPLPLAKGPCLCFPGQAQFHAGKYIEGLARAVRGAGGKIYAGAEVSEVTGGETAEIKTSDDKTISAAFVVVASTTPFNDRVTMHTKQGAYRTYVIGVTVPRDTIPEALYWDTEDPFHYVRLARIGAGTETKDILIIGGEDHKTGQTEELENRFVRLLSWGRTHFRDLGDPEFR